MSIQHGCIIAGILIFLPAIMMQATPSTPTPIPPIVTPITMTPTPPITLDPECVNANNEAPDYPECGSQDYDVQHYTIDLRVDVNEGRVTGAATLVAKACTPLSAITLDLHELEVSEVSVDGQEAAFHRETNKLLITMPTEIAQNHLFTTEVSYGGIPSSFPSAADPSTLIGWINYRDGIVVMGEPDGASSWYPVNNRPADKALYTLNIEAPKGFNVFANGNLTSITERDTSAVYHWDVPWPTSSYLISVHITPNPVITMTTSTGTTLKYQYPPHLADSAAATLQRPPEYLAFLESKFGPCPLESYVCLVIECDTAPNI